jgi:Polyketide cyclase / dehydrase and lipid transport
MPQQTVTQVSESSSEPQQLFDFLAIAENIPRWAPAFADTVERVAGSRCRVTKNGEAFEFELIANSAASTVDYVREIPGGKRAGAYLRVTPRPLGGSSVTITVPLAANTSATDVAKVLEQELTDLDRLSQA